MPVISPRPPDTGSVSRPGLTIDYRRRAPASSGKFAGGISPSKINAPSIFLFKDVSVILPASLVSALAMRRS